MSLQRGSYLKDFYIFSPTIKTKEGEEEKSILFFYPNETSIDDKVRTVGLTQALIQFCTTFTDEPCETVHTMKRRRVLYQPEPDYWIAMTINVPENRRPSTDGIEVTDYKEEEIKDPVCKAILCQAYRMFRLFMGPITRIVEAHGYDGLRQRFSHFFSRYVPVIERGGHDLIDVFNGLKFLALDRDSFMLVQSLINQVEAEFQEIEYTAFFYNSQLIWSGLEPEDMRSVYHYLTTSLLPSRMQGAFKSSDTGYVAGPPDMENEKNLGKIPRLFITKRLTQEETEYSMLVFKVQQAVFCAFIEGSIEITFDFCRMLQYILEKPMDKLVMEIKETTQQQSPFTNGEYQYRYIYYNHMNMAMKSTIHMETRARVPNPAHNLAVPMSTIRLAADLYSEINRSGSSDIGEIIAKTNTDAWVVGKKSDQREIFVVVTQKNANLVQVTEEVRRLCDNFFTGIFALD